MKPLPAFPGLPSGGAEPLFCLEMANNHQGSVEHGCNLIAELAAVVRRTRAAALLKLQFRNLESILHPADRAAGGQGALSAHSKRFSETALGEGDFRRLVDRAREEGLKTYATPFDEESVERCLEFGFEVLKIASCSAMDQRLLRKVAATGLPVIVSVAGLELSQIDDLVDFFAEAGNPLAILHCIAAYPTEEKDLQLDCIRQMQERYPGVAIGYSGHERPDRHEVAGWAVAKGARILERHVGLPAAGVKLNAYSLDPGQVEDFIRTSQRASTACALGQPRRPVPGEKESLASLKRGIYARRTIPAGKVVEPQDVFLALPCLEGQFQAGKYYEIVDSFTPMQPIYANMPLGLELSRKLPKPLVVSSIAARISEALREAKIALDDSITVELSHQYGFDRFFEVGAVIIDIVNRNYCKKLILQFPGQSHPSHRHHQKEETFHVLSGTVDLVVDGRGRSLAPGNQVLIERGRFHSFSTRTGVIFEEVSTTHIKGDSEYEDSAISSDPTLRKTGITLPT